MNKERPLFLFRNSVAEHKRIIFCFNIGVGHRDVIIQYKTKKEAFGYMAITWFFWNRQTERKNQAHSTFCWLPINKRIHFF